MSDYDALVARYGMDAAGEIRVLRDEVESRDNAITAMRQTRNDMQKRLMEQDAENERLRGLLTECVEDLEDWGSYAPAYFKEKHKFDADVAKYRAAIAGEKP